MHLVVVRLDGVGRMVLAVMVLLVRFVDVGAGGVVSMRRWRLLRRGGG